MNKVKFSGDWDKNRTKKMSKRVPFVIIFHPLVKDFCNIIQKNLYLLYMNQKTQRVFTPGPMINFRSASKLSSYLLRLNFTHSKGLLALVIVMVNDVKFVKMLQKLRLSLELSSTFNSKLNHQLNFSEKCLVYLLTYIKFFKQYVGQTVNPFRWWWNNYKSKERKLQRLEPCMQKYHHSVGF